MGATIFVEAITEASSTLYVEILSKERSKDINGWGEPGYVAVQVAPVSEEVGGITYTYHPTIPANRVRLFTHEFGHALGLDHDGLPGSIMNAGLNGTEILPEHVNFITLDTEEHPVIMDSGGREK